MQKKSGDVFKRAAGRLGDALKTFGEKSPSNRSSSPINGHSLSEQMSSGGSLATHTEMVVTPYSSSSFRNQGSASLDASRGHARSRDVTITLHLQTYGTEEQSVQTTRAMLRILQVKGFRIVGATHNGISVTAA